jgi:hypothetical protein
MDYENEPEKKTPAGWHRYWQKEFSAAKKRLEKYYARGNRVVDRYIDERNGSNVSFQTEDHMVNRLNLFHRCHQRASRPR